MRLRKLHLDLQFDDCLKKEDLNDEGLLNHSVSEEDPIDDDCNLDNNEGTRSPEFKFLKVLSFVAVISYNSYEPVYIIKILKKVKRVKKSKIVMDTL